MSEDNLITSDQIVIPSPLTDINGRYGLGLPAQVSDPLTMPHLSCQGCHRRIGLPAFGAKYGKYGHQFWPSTTWLIRPLATFWPLSLFAPDYYYAYAYYCEKAIPRSCSSFIVVVGVQLNMQTVSQMCLDLTEFKVSLPAHFQRSLDFCLFSLRKVHCQMQPFSVSVFCLQFESIGRSTAAALSHKPGCKAQKRTAGTGGRRPSSQPPTSQLPTANNAFLWADTGQMALGIPFSKGCLARAVCQG